MYKDYKRNESLDTDFVGGSGLIWMFSGIILGLLVGLGMYYFTDNNSSALSMVGTVQNKIKQAQSANPKLADNKAKVSYKPQTSVAEKPIRQTKFNYYAVLPTLEVPVGLARPINTNPLKGKANTNEALIVKQDPVVNKDPIETAEIERAVTDGDYLLQVASYKKKSRANVTRGRLTKSGIEAYIQEKKIKGRLWYRVVAGPVDQTSVGTWKHAAEKMGHRPLVISLR